MFSPSCILSRKPQKEREKNAVKQLNHFSTIMRDLLLDYWFKNQHLGLYCWTGDAKVNTEGFTAKLVMQKSILRFFSAELVMQMSTPMFSLLNWWCKCQHWGFYCWTGYAKVNNKVFTAELVMQKSTLRAFLLNWWCKTQHRCFTAELVMQKSKPMSLLLNWWLKGQHRDLYCWTGDSKVNTDLFSVDLVMKSKRWGPYYWVGDAKVNTETITA